LKLYITPEEYATAAKNGIPEGLVSYRVRTTGWSVERAITEPVRVRKPNKSRKKWGAVAKENGIKYNTYLARIYKGMTEEEAATTPVLSRLDAAKKAAKANKRFSAETLEIAKRNGICYSTMNTRLRNGWSLEEAITVKTRGYGGRKKANG